MRTLLLWLLMIVPAAAQFTPGQIMYMKDGTAMVVLASAEPDTFIVVTGRAWVLRPNVPGPNPPVPPPPVVDVFDELRAFVRSTAAPTADRAEVAAIFAEVAKQGPGRLTTLEQLLNTTRGAREIKLGAERAAAWAPWVTAVGAWLDKNKARLKPMDDYFKAWAVIAEGLKDAPDR